MKSSDMEWSSTWTGTSAHASKKSQSSSKERDLIAAVKDEGQ